MLDSIEHSCEHVVQIEGLACRDGGTAALEGISLTVKRGTALALVGPHGSGKTLLIKHVVGLRAQEGLVRVFGRDPAADPRGVLSRTGYVPEKDDLPRWMKVEELLRYESTLYPSWDERRAEELRCGFRLKPEEKVRQLSPAQRVQAQLLVALACRPQLLVLDDAVSRQDSCLRGEVRDQIIDFLKEGGTVILTSYSPEMVRLVPDDVAVLKSGRLLMRGPAEEVWDSIAGPDDCFCIGGSVGLPRSMNPAW